jgi:hypothetical protein
MADYNKSTNFTAKDTLPTGNAGKIIKGTEIDTELNAVANAIASKADINSASLTGTPAAPTATAGSNTTQIANTAFVKAEITALSLGNMSTQAKSAVDITGGTIVGITDLTVADGGTGRSTLTSNAVLVGNGTSGINSVSPGTLGNVLTSNGTAWTSAAIKGLGLGGEVWNNVTGSRAANTTYTNSRSYPIMFAVSATKSTPSNTQGFIELVVNGSVITQVQSRVGNNIDHNVVVLSSTVIVPPGQTYRANLNGDTSLTIWNELY